MGLLISALMTFALTDDAISARSVHNGRLAEGWVRSWFVGPDMNWRQVDTVLGQQPNFVAGGFGYVTCEYTKLGVSVARDISPGGKTVVGWEYRPFRP
jgi:hypothetical protein